MYERKKELHCSGSKIISYRPKCLHRWCQPIHIMCWHIWEVTIVQFVTSNCLQKLYPPKWITAWSEYNWWLKGYKRVTRCESAMFFFKHRDSYLLWLLVFSLSRHPSSEMSIALEFWGLFCLLTEIIINKWYFINSLRVILVSSKKQMKFYGKVMSCRFAWVDLFSNSCGEVLFKQTRRQGQCKAE